MSKDDSQPAFPQHIGFATNPEGMTLRDWFAGQALAGILAADSSTQSIGFVEAADLALGYADAMLKAREEKQ